MKELFEAIYSHYLDDPLSGTLKGLYHTEAPPDAEFPYCVFLLVSNTLDYTFSENFEDCLVQFNLFSDKSSPQEITQLYELLKGDTELGTGFDFLELPIDNYRTVSLVRETAILIHVDDVWQYSVTYRMLLEQTGLAAHYEISKYLYNLMSI